MRIAHWYDDDSGMIKLVPEANREHCSIGMRIAAGDSTALAEESSWTRHEPPARLADYAISLEALHTALNPNLPPFDLVRWGSGNHPPLRETHAWGHEMTFLLFAYVDRLGIVEDLDMVFRACEDDILKIHQALRSIPQASRLILADFYEGVLVSLGDSQALLEHLRTQAAHEHVSD